MEQVSGLVLGLAAGFITLATVAVLVSPNAQTSNVAGTVFKGIATDIAASVAPVMGGGASIGGVNAGLLSSLGSNLLGSASI